MDWTAIVWLILMVVFLLLETASVALISSWFAIGSLAAMIVSLCHGPLWLQGLVFGVVSVVLLACLRPLTRKYLNPKLVKTNVDSVVGQVGRVTDAINNIDAKGQVKLGGMDWSARSTTGDPIEANTLVKVDRVEGVKVFVTPVQ